MPKQASEANGNRPCQEIRYRNIRATIWKNETEKGAMYNVTVSRSYKDEAGAWHDSASFAFDDLMHLAKALHDAHSFIAAQRAKDRPAARPTGRREGRAVAP